MATVPKYLTQDELKRFFAAIDSPRDRALFGRITIRRLKNGLGGEKPLWRYTAKIIRSYLRERRDVGS